MQGLRFVQADPIRSPARAQDLILRQRVRGYLAGQLEAEYASLALEEGYLFAYGFMRPDLWRSMLPVSSRPLAAEERAVLDCIVQRGPTHPRDLDTSFGKRSVVNAWGGKSLASKRILERLHDEGLLRVCRREKGIRVYEQAISAGAPERSKADRFGELLMTALRIFGPVRESFLLSELSAHNGLVPVRRDRLALVEALVAGGRCSRVSVDDVVYLWIPENWPEGSVEKTLRILAPFDPVVRDRQRFEHLWGWSYRFEAYVPAAKRKLGYYAMPLCWGDRMIGWANAKVLDEALTVEFGYSSQAPKEKAFRKMAEQEVESLATFLGLDSGAWRLRI
ncbi:crosslink repair DNA glycosylase YcaQ family protein [Pelagicoccus sp. SDUM812003]|uniref:DNA glycosylase AlkZ-like family protein n=1 Tax=Pelagicoccus sp. SDUM812003 TaxID=3041267 RepID=UPI00280DA434|nr:crosslink repair DNA glycosylase YcaQ family protein [Pelagicoccus sp. SDUM812003]MDQ8203444.1 crosslink repair DNA glycosylase YcaQ family protein [Pelagicoccus sp. SDUM812003]